MADYASSLPVRTESDPDELLRVRLSDGTVDGQLQEVDTDGNAHVEVHGNDSGATDRTLRLSEEGRVALLGDYDASTNTEPSSTGLVAHDRGASIDETSQNKRLTAVAGEDDTVCLDVALRDESGAAYDADNPLPVSFEESEGDEIIDYDTASSIAKNASDNHDYTVSATKTLLLDEIWCTASGKMKVEVQLETAAASGVFNTKWVGFNSTSTPNIRIPAKKIGKQVTGAIVRIIRTNLDQQAQDLYSTIVGIEK